MATALQFSRNIRKRSSKIENAAVDAVKRAGQVALRSLVLGSPVDKGVARSNWRVSTGNPTRAIIGAYSPGRKLGIAERANARAAISIGNAKIRQLKVGAKRGTGQAGSALFITNSIPYLDKLRAGRSSQQPNDWVDDAFQEARLSVRQTRLIG